MIFMGQTKIPKWLSVPDVLDILLKGIAHQKHAIKVITARHYLAIDQDIDHGLLYIPTGFEEIGSFYSGDGIIIPASGVVMKPTGDDFAKPPVF